MAKTKKTPRKNTSRLPLTKEFVSSDSSSSNTSLSSSSSNSSINSSSSCSTCSSTTCSTCSSSSSSSNLSSPHISSSTSTVDYTHLLHQSPLVSPIRQASELHKNSVNNSPIASTSTHPFPTKPTIQQKIKAPPSITRFRCNICPKTYSRLATLRRHVLDVHMDRGRSYECPVCTKRLTRSDSLRVHMKRVHHMIDIPKVAPTPRPAKIDTIIPIDTYVKPWESLTRDQQRNPVFQVRKATKDYDFKHNSPSTVNNPGHMILYKGQDGKYSTTKTVGSRATVVKNLYGVYTTKKTDNQTSYSTLAEDLKLSDTESDTSDVHPNFWDQDEFMIIDEC